MPRQKMPVMIRGVTYPDAEAAAKALRVAVDTVYCGIIRGNPDRIGLGPDYAARPHKGGKPPKPVTVAGQRFASMAELARAIGREPRAVRVSLRAGGIAKDRIVRAVMALIAARENAAMRAAMKDQQKHQGGDP